MIFKVGKAPSGRSDRNSAAQPEARGGFTATDLLVVIAVVALLAAIVVVPLTKARERAALTACLSNLQQVGRGILLYADDHSATFPGPSAALAGDFWWWYKEQIKGYIGVRGVSSADDIVFGCPRDRGYSDPMPFRMNPRFDYGSYVFNGVTLPGVPNIAGWRVANVKEPARTLSVMEWVAHGPLSWHRSRTGKANAPFYTDAETVAAFADGHVQLTTIYYDGYNAAYTRDPIPGYEYKYSGN